MSAQLKLQNAELAERIESLTPEDRRNAFLMKSLNRDIEKLFKQDSIDAFCMLAAVAIRENDIKAMRDNLDKALRINQKSFVANFNYAIGLGISGYYSESTEYFNRAYNDNPLLVLGRLVDHHAFAGKFELANECLKEFNKLKPQKPHHFENALLDIDEFIEQKNVEEKHVAKMMEITFSLLQENGIYYSVQEMSIGEDEDSQWLDYEIKIDKPVDEIVRLNVEHSRRLTEAGFPLNASFYVIIGITSED